MKAARTYILYCIAAAFALTAITGCLTQKEEICEEKVTLTLTYTHNADDTDLFHEQVKSAEIFVYNSQGILVDRFVETFSGSEDDNTVEMELLPDYYTIVIWGNLEEDSFVATGVEDMNTMRIEVASATGNVGDDTAELFHGMVGVQVEVGAPVNRTVSLIKDSNKVQIVLDGALNTETRSLATAAYAVRIQGSNGAYSYDNSIAYSVGLQYMPSYGLHGGAIPTGIEAGFGVLRITTGGDLRIVVTADGETVIDDYLAAVIIQHIEAVNNNDDLDRYDDYTLTYKIEGGEWVIAGIKVNDWEYTPELGGGI